MIEIDHNVEVLAMNIWLGIFGVTALRDDWIQFAKTNKQQADEYRKQAAEMMGVALRHTGAPVGRTMSHHHGLGWLFNAG